MMLFSLVFLVNTNVRNKCIALSLLLLIVGVFHIREDDLLARMACQAVFSNMVAAVGSIFMDPIVVRPEPAWKLLRQNRKVQNRFWKRKLPEESQPQHKWNTLRH